LNDEEPTVIPPSEAERLARLDEVMGKYKDVPTSSEAFMKRKYAELTLNPDA
jgi:hypothetical protein